jgi:hypothetical protein
MEDITIIHAEGRTFIEGGATTEHANQFIEPSFLKVGPCPGYNFIQLLWGYQEKCRE